MRLIDRIRTGLPLALDRPFVDPAKWNAFVATLRSSLDRCPAIIADGINEFALSKLGLLTGEPQQIPLSDFHSGPPPYEQFWVEWTKPNPNVACQGVMCRSSRLEDGWRLDSYDILLPTTQRIGIVMPNGFAVDIDKSGAITNAALSSLRLRFGSDVDWVSPSLAVVFATIALMACRNVRVDWRDISPKLDKRFAEKYAGKRMKPMQTIDFTPLSRLLPLRREGQTETEHRATAAHLMRGHFKTYTVDSPLLGHATGTYFWGPQVRGGKLQESLRPPKRIKLNLKGSRK